MELALVRLYFGSTALLLAVGFVCGCAVGWLLTRAYFVRVLRGIQRRIAGACAPLPPSCFYTLEESRAELERILADVDPPGGNP